MADRVKPGGRLHTHSRGDQRRRSLTGVATGTFFETLAALHITTVNRTQDALLSYCSRSAVGPGNHGRLSAACRSLGAPSRFGSLQR